MHRRSPARGAVPLRWRRRREPLATAGRTWGTSAKRAASESRYHRQKRVKNVARAGRPQMDRADGFTKRKRPVRVSGPASVAGCGVALGRYGATWAANFWLLLPVQFASMNRAPSPVPEFCTSMHRPGAAAFLNMKMPEPTPVSPLIQAWVYWPLQSCTSSIAPATAATAGPMHLLVFTLILNLTLPLPADET